MSIGVVVATYGDDNWKTIAKRALASVERQTTPPEAVIHVHADTLQAARNSGAEEVKTEWLIFLDADDELDERYVEEMRKGWGDLRQPATRGVLNGREDMYPIVIKERPLLESNYLVIGTMCERERFWRVGGFNDYPVLEDWDLWIRMWKDGAQIRANPHAIYKVHVNPASRNQEQAVHHRYYAMIRSKYGA